MKVYIFLGILLIVRVLCEVVVMRDINSWFKDPIDSEDIDIL